MATDAQVSEWTTWGGTVEQKKARGKASQVFVAPSGEKLTSWEAAKEYMQHKQGDDKENMNKRQKTNTAATPAGKPTAEEDTVPSSKKKTNNKRKPTEDAPVGSAKRSAAKPTRASAKKPTKDADAADNTTNNTNTTAAADNTNTAAAAPTAEVTMEDAKAAAPTDATTATAAPTTTTTTTAAATEEQQQKPATKAPRGGRRAAKDNMDEVILIKEEPSVEDEVTALKELGEPEDGMYRLSDFVVVDAAGDMQPLDAMTTYDKELFVTGAIYCKATDMKNKDNGRRVQQRLGPITTWNLNLKHTEQAPSVTITTAGATYLAVKPAQRYRSMHGHLVQQGAIAWEVLGCIDPARGGSVDTSLEAVIARLTRAGVTKEYPSAREALVVNGKFLLRQLTALDTKTNDKGKGKAGASLKDCTFASALTKEVDIASTARRNATGTIVIHDVQANAEEGAAMTDAQAADEEFARQLQAKLDAEEMARSRGRATGGKGGVTYIKISESEIADDYPMPKQYEKPDEETDEVEVFFDEDLVHCDPEYLPRKLLTDFAIYNTEGFMATLELLPLWRGADPDVELYASGLVTEDDGSWQGAHPLVVQQPTETAAAQEPDSNEAGGSNDAGGSGAGGSGAGGSGNNDGPAGMRLFLSQIREWIVEYSCDALFISLRTDMAWYKLCTPAATYQPWFDTVLKASRVSVKVLAALEEESRASKVSFNDIIKRLADISKEDPAHISKNVNAVERFVVVHGQIVLNQFHNYPKETIKRSAFVTTLKQRMETRRHTKFVAPKGPVKSIRVRVGRINNNPMRMRDAIRRKPMTATATAAVRKIWQTYFTVAQNEAERQQLEQAKREEATAAAAAAGGEVMDDLNELEEDDADNEEGGASGSSNPTTAAPTTTTENPTPISPNAKAMRRTTQALTGEVVFVGPPTKTAGALKLYTKAKAGIVEVCVGDGVVLKGRSVEEEDKQGPLLGLVQALWEDSKGKPFVQLRVLVRGEQTVLGDAAWEPELFLTDAIMTKSLKEVANVFGVTAAVLREWDPLKRAHYVDQVEALKQAFEDSTKQQGGKLQYYYRLQWHRPTCRFMDVPKDLQLGTKLQEPAAPEQGVVKTSTGFRKDGVDFPIGCYMYVAAGVFQPLAGAIKDTEKPEYAAKGRFVKGGANHGLLARGVCQLISVSDKSSKGKLTTNKDNVCIDKISVRRFYHPEDVDQDLAYKAASHWEVYYSNTEVEVSVDDIVGKCTVGGKGTLTGPEMDVFACTHTVDPKTKKLSDPPAEYGGSDDTAGDAMDVDAAAPKTPSPHALATMDIFAGCGGLSEGLHQAGIAVSKWAIEYEYPASEAFKLNHPDAAVFCHNCNVLLAAAMIKAGQVEECTASEEAIKQAGEMSEEMRAALPLPGEVDFITGGPPCQGYSGMNRFNKGLWSVVQNSMVMSFLSYADFYRPKYFMLENVRNFVSHNKGFTFRLVLRTLLSMGYQVRFGVLNAGNFGVAQSRKRTIIWAAAPGYPLPDWPSPQHVFASSQMGIALPDGTSYTAYECLNAPLRSVTVRDAIADLPPIENGADMDELEYTTHPVSAFQRAIRGDATVLHDHISKRLNELNMERCRCIPKGVPGADWRVLEQIVRDDPTREKFNGQPLVPWCLPHTADRHNGWRGLFGRLDYQGHFPTSTTDPQPMGKVGQVFHPDQDRIVSVRECARAQGFPDRYRFWGNVHNKHRQIGNAVPPPLAFNLGRKLREALEKRG